MKMRQLLSPPCFLLALLILLSASEGRAADFSAISCNQPDVRTAINNASDGDRVLVPAGNCTWTTGISFCKSITVQGAGAASTTIVSNFSGNMLSVQSPCSGKTVRLTSMTIRNTLSSSSGILFFNCGGCTLRIDHNTYVGNTALSVPYRVLWLNRVTQGVMDHNTITDMGLMIAGQAVGEADVAAGSVSWNDPPSFGTSNTFYIEDNTFNFVNHGADIDCVNGGRVVWRFNTFNKSGPFSQTSTTGPFNHGFDSVARSCFQMDAYNNTIIGGGYMGIQFRGGSGLVYNNVVSGHWDQTGIGLTNYRSGTGLACDPGIPNSCNQCNGTVAVDGNTAPTSSNFGWPCRDQVGRGTTAGSFPVYAWNNCITALGCTPGGIDSVPAVAYASGGTPNYTSQHIQANRDFYNAVASFNGTVGVGQGSISLRPGTCTTGVAYWDTGNNVLYKCTATNTWSTYYTPFAYPHPITLNAPQQPTGFSVIK